MAVIGQSHLVWRSRVPDHIYHSNTIVPIEASLYMRSRSQYIEFKV